MLSNRLALHEELCSVLGSRNVYFQPPENLHINYPCIVYSREPDTILNADDSHYISREHYELMVIDHDPDSTIADDLVSNFKYCKIDRYYKASNLNHTTLTLHY